MCDAVREHDSELSDGDELMYSLVRGLDVRRDQSGILAHRQEMEAK